MLDFVVQELFVPVQKDMVVRWEERRGENRSQYQSGRNRQGGKRDIARLTLPMRSSRSNGFFGLVGGSSLFVNR